MSIKSGDSFPPIICLISGFPISWNFVLLVTFCTSACLCLYSSSSIVLPEGIFRLSSSLLILYFPSLTAVQNLSAHCAFLLAHIWGSVAGELLLKPMEFLNFSFRYCPIPSASYRKFLSDMWFFSKKFLTNSAAVSEPTFVNVCISNRWFPSNAPMTNASLDSATSATAVRMPFVCSVFSMSFRMCSAWMSSKPSSSSPHIPLMSLNDCRPPCCASRPKYRGSFFLNIWFSPYSPSINANDVIRSYLLPPVFSNLLSNMPSMYCFAFL